MSERRRSPWMWVSAVLAVVAAGLLIWGLATKSDLDGAQADLTTTQAQLDEAKQPQPTATPAEESGGAGGALVAAGGLAAAKAVYDDLTAQLGATEQDLAQTEKDLEEANAAAKQAGKEVDAAEKKAADAGNDTEKAEAEADKAKAEVKAAESKAAVVADCAKAYVGALGALFEGDDVAAQAPKVGEQLKSISGDCRAAFADG